MAQNETHYNKIIGVTKDGQLAILEYTFEDSENFKGAVGNLMGTITKGYIEDRKDFEYADEEIWRSQVQEGYTDLGFEDWWEELVEESEMNDELFPYDDSSYRYETERLYEELSDEDRAKVEEVLGVMGKDYITFNCEGGGRCFNEDMEWEVVLEPELLEKALKLEHREPVHCAECGKELGGKTGECIYHNDSKEVCSDCDKTLTEKHKATKEKEVTMKVAGYLMNLPKDQVVKMILTRIPSYKLKDVCEQATGESSDWMYVNESTMDSEVQV